MWIHIFCDLWTNYGTHATWPSSQARSAMDLVSVLDPLLTAPLLVLTLLALWKKRLTFAKFALAWVALYLTLAAVQQQRARHALSQLISHSGTTTQRTTVKPSFGNILVWRAWHPDEPGVLGDMRNAQLPHPIAPLWGIKFNPTQPQRHIRMATIRRTDREIWLTLWRMICGKMP